MREEAKEATLLLCGTKREKMRTMYTGCDVQLCIMCCTDGVFAPSGRAPDNRPGTAYKNTTRVALLSRERKKVRTNKTKQNIMRRLDNAGLRNRRGRTNKPATYLGAERSTIPSHFSVISAALAQSIAHAASAPGA